ncbi:MAG: phage holin family protein [Candidatus Accumulibacter sp.]|jgi:uncharacterized membrane protein YqjE|nr:phage holin family protein [Accumulibacter sp.]
MADHRRRPNPSGRGLFSSLKNVVSVLLESAGTRFELLANEIQEEKLRCVNLAMLALGAAFCLGAALLIAVFFLTALFWESRVALLGVLAAVFATVGGVLAVLLRRALSRRQGIFEASLAELREDIRQLKEATRPNGDAE